MHTFSETGAGVPAFLAKLWRLVEDPETNKLICWSQDGRSFIIQNQAQFARELLPLNYKHNNMASFIRQLNMYGFHKITSIDNGGLKFDRDEMEFTHPCFKRNCPYLLEHIKRKIASTKSGDEKSTLKPEAVTKVLQDVKAMRGRQDSLDSRFSVMKQENEALWREIASLRQKHAKQQQIVNKLIQFLITIVQPQRNMTSVKRHMQLMINDIPEKAKKHKANESETECGPVIHELSEELLDEVSEVEPETMVPNSPFTRVSTPATPYTDQDIVHSPHNVERPQSSVSMMTQNFEFSNESVEDSGECLNPEVAGNDGVIQTVNNDGSKIFYHITEVPDAQPQEVSFTPVSYDEDNVLTTPLVREEMARKLRQKNRQRLSKTERSENRIDNITYSSKNKLQRLESQQQTSLREQELSSHETPQLMQIKSEQDASVDPMIFLNVAYSNSRDLAPDANLISPSLSDDSLQPNTEPTGKILMKSTTLRDTAVLKGNNFMADSSSNLYDPNSFITNDIPADIFENDPTINNKEDGICIKNAYFQKDDRTPFQSSTINRESQPSTSAAAFGSSASSNSNSNKRIAIAPSSPSAVKRETFSNMALTKYKNNQDLMRLSTPDEVSGHLENVQDELEGLKDLLRGDVYSLDQNALLGMSLNEINSIQNPKHTLENINHQIVLPPALDEDILYKLFYDSDVLGPYGLHLPNDVSSSNNKKGSELMTYQPMYDLSDIINDQNDLDAEVNVPTTSKFQTQPQTKQDFNDSVLNTPYHV